MFLIELTYKVAFSEIEPFMAEHLAFVEKGFASGYFVASGRKVPRDGGLIFCQAASKTEVEEFLQQDPFVYQDLVELRIVEFIASRTTAGMTGLAEA
ncbi:YciI family protein [Rufibacter sediminis]|uniref:GTP cyclohydrolase n=1 Tax=Rufibacter sediminis TaxID=2762756 RepID=A0ABR6VXK7_9BACT|nr:YciI family protein [Rufibacter sediminis]MBC3541874.1 GTP cyclohydrolase [Rufibacter sediminis]